ncbi:MAG: ribonuclease P protein component [Alphaproteobacteria bacterium]|nr:ribonuclease P protein component [Alphaproteobacteria bacterium]
MRKRSVFLDVSKNGSCFRTKSVVVICKLGNGGGISVGYTASRRVGGAVSRNFAKRRLRALTREFSSEFVPGGFFVFIATKWTVDLEFSVLRCDFLYALRKAKESEFARVK